eukprot:gnl/Dysnectes_brevis/2589_a3125_642.p1 GENE.gnl/Dysnectes_brevis/2589_a3125_642~~gnl/Dysnectes_brevis/2589_a3125_642.p1  ORF type:complete len:3753 (-),score=514.02 gnl/Dysnectes_brevis/2589_a3125_642:65-9661(-)
MMLEELKPGKRKKLVDLGFNQYFLFIFGCLEPLLPKIFNPPSVNQFSKFNALISILVSSSMWELAYLLSQILELSQNVHDRVHIKFNCPMFKVEAFSSSDPSDEDIVFSINLSPTVPGFISKLSVKNLSDTSSSSWHYSDTGTETRSKGRTMRRVHWNHPSSVVSWAFNEIQAFHNQYVNPDLSFVPPMTISVPSLNTEPTRIHILQQMLYSALSGDTDRLMLIKKRPELSHAPAATVLRGISQVLQDPVLQGRCDVKGFCRGWNDFKSFISHNTGVNCLSRLISCQFAESAAPSILKSPSPTGNITGSQAALLQRGQLMDWIQHLQAMDVFTVPSLPSSNDDPAVSLSTVFNSWLSSLDTLIVKLENQELTRELSHDKARIKNKLIAFKNLLKDWTGRRYLSSSWAQYSRPVMSSIEELLLKDALKSTNINTLRENVDSISKQMDILKRSTQHHSDTISESNDRLTELDLELVKLYPRKDSSKYFHSPNSSPKQFVDFFMAISEVASFFPAIRKICGETDMFLIASQTVSLFRSRFKDLSRLVSYLQVQKQLRKPSFNILLQSVVVLRVADVFSSQRRMDADSFIACFEHLSIEQHQSLFSSQFEFPTDIFASLVKLIKVRLSDPQIETVLNYVFLPGARHKVRRSFTDRLISAFDSDASASPTNWEELKQVLSPDDYSYIRPLVQGEERLRTFTRDIDAQLAVFETSLRDQDLPSRLMLFSLRVFNPDHFDRSPDKIWRNMSLAALRNSYALKIEEWAKPLSLQQAHNHLNSMLTPDTHASSTYSASYSTDARRSKFLLDIMKYYTVNQMIEHSASLSDVSYLSAASLLGEMAVPSPSIVADSLRSAIDHVARMLVLSSTHSRDGSCFCVECISDHIGKCVYSVLVTPEDCLDMQLSGTEASSALNSLVLSPEHAFERQCRTVSSQSRILERSLQDAKKTQRQLISQRQELIDHLLADVDNLTRHLVHEYIRKEKCLSEQASKPFFVRRSSRKAKVHHHSSGSHWDTLAHESELKKAGHLQDRPGMLTMHQPHRHGAQQQKPTLHGFQQVSGPLQPGSLAERAIDEQAREPERPSKAVLSLQARRKELETEQTRIHRYLGIPDIRSINHVVQKDISSIISQGETNLPTSKLVRSVPIRLEALRVCLNETNAIISTIWRFEEQRRRYSDDRQSTEAKLRSCRYVHPNSSLDPTRMTGSDIGNISTKQAIMAIGGGEMGFLLQSFEVRFEPFRPLLWENAVAKTLAVLSITNLLDDEIQLSIEAEKTDHICLIPISSIVSAKKPLQFAIELVSKTSIVDKPLPVQLSATIVATSRLYGTASTELRLCSFAIPTLYRLECQDGSMFVLDHVDDARNSSIVAKPSSNFRLSVQFPANHPSIFHPKDSSANTVFVESGARNMVYRKPSVTVQRNFIFIHSQEMNKNLHCSLKGFGLPKLNLYRLKRPNPLVYRSPSIAVWEAANSRMVKFKPKHGYRHAGTMSCTIRKPINLEDVTFNVFNPFVEDRSFTLQNIKLWRNSRFDPAKPDIKITVPAGEISDAIRLKVPDVSHIVITFSLNFSSSQQPIKHSLNISGSAEKRYLLVSLNTAGQYSVKDELSRSDPRFSDSAWQYHVVNVYQALKQCKDVSITSRATEQYIVQPQRDTFLCSSSRSRHYGVGLTEQQLVKCCKIRHPELIKLLKTLRRQRFRCSPLEGPEDQLNALQQAFKADVDLFEGDRDRQLAQLHQNTEGFLPSGFETPSVCVLNGAILRDLDLDEESFSLTYHESDPTMTSSVMPSRSLSLSASEENCMLIDAFVNIRTQRDVLQFMQLAVDAAKHVAMHASAGASVQDVFELLSTSLQLCDKLKTSLMNKTHLRHIYARAVQARDEVHLFKSTLTSKDACSLVYCRPDVSFECLPWTSNDGGSHHISPQSVESESQSSVISTRYGKRVHRRVASLGDEDDMDLDALFITGVRHELDATDPPSEQIKPTEYLSVGDKIQAVQVLIGEAAATTTDSETPQKAPDVAKIVGVENISLSEESTASIIRDMKQDLSSLMNQMLHYLQLDRKDFWKLDTGNESLDPEFTAKEADSELLEAVYHRILSLSENISSKVLDKTTVVHPVSVCIMVDCSCTLRGHRRTSQLVILGAIMSILSDFEIPFSVFTYADRKFQFRIKRPTDPFDPLMLRRVIDSVVDRPNSMLADALVVGFEQGFEEDSTVKTMLVISDFFSYQVIGDKFDWEELLDTRVRAQITLCNIAANFPASAKHASVIPEALARIESHDSVFLASLPPSPAIRWKDCAQVVIDTLASVISNGPPIIHKAMDWPEHSALAQPRDNWATFSEHLVLPKIDRSPFIHSHDPSSFALLCQDLHPKPYSAKPIPQRVGRDLSDHDTTAITKLLIRVYDLVKTSAAMLGTNMLPPNIATQNVPHVTGNRLHIPNLIRQLATGTEPKIWISKRGGKVRQYSVSLVFDMSRSTMSYSNLSHSFVTFIALLRLLAALDIANVDVVLAGNSSHVVCDNMAASDILNPSSPLWNALLAMISSDQTTRGLPLAVREAIELQNSRCVSETRLVFTLTDGLFDPEVQDTIRALHSLAVPSQIQIIGVGVGIHPVLLPQSFIKSVWASSPSTLGRGLSALFGAVTDTRPEIHSLHCKLDMTGIDDIMGRHHDHHCRDYFSSRPHLFTTVCSDIINQQSLDAHHLNSLSTRNPEGSQNDLLRDNSITDQSILIAMFYTCRGVRGRSGSILDTKVTPDMLINGEDGKSVVNVLKSKGFTVDVVYDYYSAIKRIVSSTYSQVWIANCSPGDGILPSQASNKNANLVGQFIDCLLRFWSTGGAVNIFGENEPFSYELNLFLERAIFPSASGPIKTKLRMLEDGTRSHPGEKTIKCSPSLTRIEKTCFDARMKWMHPQLSHSIPSLRAGLKYIYEGETLAVVNSCQDEDILPFKVFAMSSSATPMPTILRYIPDDLLRSTHGPIFIDTAATKLTYEFTEEGTARYIANLAAIPVIIQKERECILSSYDRPSIFPPRVSFSINTAVKWSGFKRPQGHSASLHTIMLLDFSGSMGGNMSKLQTAANKYCAYRHRRSSSDTISIIYFDGGIEVVGTRLPLTPNSVPLRRSRGGTSFEPPLRHAVSLNPISGSLVIFFTDGRASSSPTINQHIDALRSRGCTLHTVGLGSSVNTAVLTNMASRGNGKYFASEIGSLGDTFEQIGRGISKDR